MARDLIAIMDDIPADSFSLDVTVVLPAAAPPAAATPATGIPTAPGRPTSTCAVKARSVCAIAQCMGALDEPAPWCGKQ